MTVLVNVEKRGDAGNFVSQEQYGLKIHCVMDGPLAVAVSLLNTKETEILRSHLESLLVAEITLLHSDLAFCEKLQALIKKNIFIYFFSSSQLHMSNIKELGSKTAVVNTRKLEKNYDLLSNF